MKRRDFLAASAVLTGTAFSSIARAQSQPCPPGTVKVAGGGTALSECGVTNSGLPQWLSSASINQWVALTPAVSLDSVAPSGVLGGTGVRSVTNAWGGAAVRNSGSYYLLHGGGHGDYAGNEIYALQLSSAAPAWTRVWGPSASQAAGVPYYADGNPASIHTQYTLVYDQIRDRLMRMAGGCYQSPSGYNTNIDSWNWNGSNWNPAGTHPTSQVGGGGYSGHARNTRTGDVYSWQLARRGVWRSASNTYQLVTQYENIQLEYAPLVYDPVRNCLWSQGGTPYGVSGSGLPAGNLLKWDCATDTTSQVTVPGLASQLSVYHGACYDSANDCVWFLTAGSGHGLTGEQYLLYRFDPARLAFSTPTIVGSARPTLTQGVSGGEVEGPLGRFQYVPELKGIVVQPNWTSPVYFMRTA